MENFFNKISTLSEPTTLLLLCGILIFADILTGYTKAIKYKKINSSVSRDGFTKKIGWGIAIILGYLIDLLLNINIFLIGSAFVCIATEGMSIYENLGELGINLPFKSYFQKLKDSSDK